MADPKAYLTMKRNDGKVQVVYRADAVAQGTDADMLAYLRKNFPDVSPTRFINGEFVPVTEETIAAEAQEDRDSADCACWDPACWACGPRMRKNATLRKGGDRE